jgi:hypothetical protein
MNEKLLATDNTVGHSVTGSGAWYPPKMQRMGLCIRIETAENGHIVHVAQREGEVSKPYIAAKYEDVADIVMRELAAAALERT